MTMVLDCKKPPAQTAVLGRDMAAEGGPAAKRDAACHMKLVRAPWLPQVLWQHGRSSRPACCLGPHSRTPPIYHWKLMGLEDIRDRRKGPMQDCFLSRSSCCASSWKCQKQQKMSTSKKPHTLTLICTVVGSKATASMAGWQPCHFMRLQFTPSCCMHQGKHSHTFNCSSKSLGILSTS